MTTTNPWQDWTTTRPEKEGLPLLVRVKVDSYTSIRLEVFADRHPHPREPKEDPFRASRVIKRTTPTAILKWFGRRPHPDSGYGAYDGRCAACGSTDTLCLALAFRAIAPSVDEMLGDVACQHPECGKYTRFTYSRDSS